MARTFLEAVVFVMICTSAVLAGIDIDMQINGGETNSISRLETQIFIPFFVLEVLVRIISKGPCHYLMRSRDICWNYFDMLIVCLSVLDAAVREAEVDSGELLRLGRTLRITRLIRIGRMARLIKFISALRTLIYSISVAVRSLIWAIVLITMVTYGFAVTFAQAYQAHQQEKNNVEIVTDLSTTREDYEKALDEYWSGVTQCMLTLFMCVTGGVSWEFPFRGLLLCGYTWTSLFLLYIFVTVFAILNVITGAFCHSAVESASLDKELAIGQMMENRRAYDYDILRLFRSVDFQRSGMITVEEFEKALQNERLQAYMTTLDIDIDNAWLLFRLLDNDNMGYVDLDKFVTGCVKLRGGAKAIHFAMISADNLQMRHMLESFSLDTKMQLDVLLSAVTALRNEHA